MVARVLLVVVAIVAVAGVAAAAWVGHLNSSMSVGGSEGQKLSRVLKQPASSKKDAPLVPSIVFRKKPHRSWGRFNFLNLCP